MGSPSAIMAAALICALALAMANSVVLAQDAPDDFLRAHNRARRRVHVPDVEWDDGLARHARRHAALCDFSSGGGPYGENLFWGRAKSGLHAADAVASWVGEGAYYHCKSNSCSAPRGETCDHYTQVVWKRTARIGCARVVCPGHGVPIYYFVCKYDPAGNVGGRRPYTC